MSGAVMNAALPVGCANATGNGEEWQSNRIGGDEMEVVLAMKKCWPLALESTIAELPA